MFSYEISTVFLIGLVPSTFWFFKLDVFYSSCFQSVCFFFKYHVFLHHNHTSLQNYSFSVSLHFSFSANFSGTKPISWLFTFILFFCLVCFLFLHFVTSACSFYFFALHFDSSWKLTAYLLLWIIFLFLSNKNFFQKKKCKQFQLFLSTNKPVFNCGYVCMCYKIVFTRKIILNITDNKSQPSI